MSFPAILALAVGLAMDAMAAAAARGVAAPRVRAQDVVAVAALFGGMGGLMPLLGGLLGAAVGPWLEAFDHWIAFVLLGGIGLKMLKESRELREESASDSAAFRLRLLAGLAVATSIDTFAAGITLPVLGAPLGTACLTIGLTTAFFSALGVSAGHRMGLAVGRGTDAFGGLVLIGIGTKILIEHLFFH